MPRGPMENSTKQRAREFYESYEGDKISFNSFYQLCRKDSEADWEKAIQHKTRTYKVKYKGRWAEEMERYDKQPEPKTTKVLFRNRIIQGLTKNEAILTGEKWEALREKRARQRRFTPPTKTYVATYSTPRGEEEFNPDYYRIDITYPSEVAKVFRKTYEQLIEETEEEMRFETEKLLLAELNTKLELLKAQLDIFNSYNK